MLKFKTSKVVPIALALIIPGLSLVTRRQFILEDLLGFFLSWIVVSIFVYALWTFLWYTWEVKPLWKRYLLIATSFVLNSIGVSTLRLMAGDDLEDLKLYYIARLIFSMTLIMIIQYALKTQENLSKLLLEKEQLDTENYKAQLQALRAKTEPHFLFNSLNTLRSMIHQQHVNSEQFVMSLSDFYRHTLKYEENSTILLSEELDVLESYLFVMKSRNEQAVLIDIHIDPQDLEWHIPTLALQIVVENCFKHNSMSSRNPLHITIHSTKNHYVEIVNNKQPRVGDTFPSGRGLELLKKRYKLLNESDGVMIHHHEHFFKVRLKLIQI
jgi:LytS/YehU family sensor histidine kinase